MRGTSCKRKTITSKGERGDLRTVALPHPRKISDGLTNASSNKGRQRGKSGVKKASEPKKGEVNGDSGAVFSNSKQQTTATLLWIDTLKKNPKGKTEGNSGKGQKGQSSKAPGRTRPAGGYRNWVGWVTDHRKGTAEPRGGERRSERIRKLKDKDGIYLRGSGAYLDRGVVARCCLIRYFGNAGGERKKGRGREGARVGRDDHKTGKGAGEASRLRLRTGRDFAEKSLARKNEAGGRSRRGSQARARKEMRKTVNMIDWPHFRHLGGNKSRNKEGKKG